MITAIMPVLHEQAHLGWHAGTVARRVGGWVRLPIDLLPQQPASHFLASPKLADRKKLASQFQIDLLAFYI